MDGLDVALDVEGVLADSHAATEARSEMLHEDICPPRDWDFPTEEHFDEFMHVSQNLWHNHHEDIDPMVGSVGAASARLDIVHDVDIVTHRTNVDEQVQAWLDAHDIVYDDFHVAHGPKSEVGAYDVHIDDSPNVAEDTIGDHRVVFLIDRPYNDHVDCGDYRVRRVSDVAEAAEQLTDPNTIIEIKRLTRQSDGL